MQQKEGLFSAVLVEVYKVHVKDRLVLPETANFFDLAVKMCQQELNHRKNLEKGLAAAQMQSVPAPAAMGHIEVKSVSEINRSVTTPVATNVKTGTVKSGSSGSARSRGRVPKASTTSQSSSAAAALSSLPGMSTLPTSANDLNALIYSMYSSPLFNQLMQDKSASAMSAGPNALMNQYLSLCSGLQSSLPSNMGNMANLPGMDLSSSFLAGLLPSSSKGAIPKASQKPLLKSQAPKPTARPSSFQLEFNESIKNSNPFGGLKQNLISNSLSITTTSVSSSLTNTSTTAGSMKSHANILKMSTSITPTVGSKKSNKDQSRKQSGLINPLSINSLAYGYPKSLNLPPDLPKSLSITPAPAKASTSMRGMPEKMKKSHVSIFYYWGNYSILFNT